MTAWGVDPLLGQVARLFLAGLLLTSAIHKARTLRAFTGIVAAYRLLPAGFIRPVSASLPLVEMVAAAALLVPATGGFGARMAAALFLLFFAAVTINLGRGRTTIDCGCTLARGGGGLTVWHLVRLALLIGMTAVAGMANDDRLQSLFDYVNAVAAVTSLAILYLAADALLANHARMRTRHNEKEPVAHA